MIEYIAGRVISGNLDYCKVITNPNVKKLNPDIKEQLDQELIVEDHPELIRTDCIL